MGLVNDIKQAAKKSAGNKSKFLYFKEGSKIRVRFLEDAEDGMKIVTHRHYERGINVVCLADLTGEECEYCDDGELATRDEYLWCVYDYDAKEVRILQGAANKWSPIPQLISMYEAYGTLLDRDYVISQEGKAQSKSFSVVPMDKAIFRNKKVKPISEKQKIEIIKKAYLDEDEEDEEEAKANKKKKVSKLPTKTKKKKAKTFKEKLEELEFDALQSILEEFEDEDAEDIEDAEELAEYLIENYEEDDIIEALEELEIELEG